MSREWDLNPRPADYESAALPLSYLGLYGDRISLALQTNFDRRLKLKPQRHLQKHQIPKLSVTMLSKKCKYAIHALLHMAKRPQDQFVIKEISNECNIPRKFLESILLELKKAGMLGSKQGKGGGYFLRKTTAEINLADVVRLFDGAIAAVPCASFKFYERCAECVEEETCSVRDAFLQIRNATVEMLKADTLETMLIKEANLRTKKKR
jgi:Rrf2 family protein